MFLSLWFGYVELGLFWWDPVGSGPVWFGKKQYKMEDKTMKKVPLILEDEQYEELIKKKGKMTWVEFVMQLAK
jgi:hypothetical protein